MTSRARDRSVQAERDFRWAQESARGGCHERACFAAHHAAEKAVKALPLHFGQQAWGHAVSRLLRELPATARVPPEPVEKAQALDAYYIPPRYPNSHPEGAPFEHYGPLQSREALTYAGEILGFARAQTA